MNKQAPQKMPPRQKGCLIAFLSVAALCILLQLPASIQDAETRRNRDKAMELIAVGQSLEEAESVLQDAGFRLLHDEPASPTINKDYLQQLVIIGDTKANAFDTVAYFTGSSWMPFTSTESPFLVIEADLDGIITDIH